MNPTPSMPAGAAVRLPALFISHGAPLFATEAGRTGPALTRLGQALRGSTPLRGVVVMSPHWMSRGLAVGTGAQPATWHDFGGFPPELYTLQYPAPGDPALAARVLQHLAAAGLSAQPDARRPFDHGAWVPLMHLLPQADVPLVQVSLPVGADARAVHAIGRALAPLAAEGVLLIGSGSMTHNLAEFFGGQRAPAPYVLAFSQWIEQAVARGDLQALFDWQRQAPHAARAHPSDDHFLPLFFALGAGAVGEQGAPALTMLSREVMYGMLGMHAMALGALPAGVAEAVAEVA